jgi:coenzyme PQQ precursor peptide PqqA
MESERMATEAPLSLIEEESVQNRPSRQAAMVWEEPEFEVVEAGAEVTAYVYRR